MKRSAGAVEGFGTVAFVKTTESAIVIHMYGTRSSFVGYEIKILMISRLNSKSLLTFLAENVTKQTNLACNAHAQCMVLMLRLLYARCLL